MQLKRVLLLSFSVALMVACVPGQSGAVKDSSAAENTIAASKDVAAEVAGAASDSEETINNSASTTAVNASKSGVIKSGSFVSGEHDTSGVARIINSDGQFFLELDETFQTSSVGPDLVIVLHRSADVIGSTEPPAFPLRGGEYVVLAELASFSGAQRYAISADVNLDDYRSVAIWCRRFNATFGAATLQ